MLSVDSRSDEDEEEEEIKEKGQNDEATESDGEDAIFNVKDEDLKKWHKRYFSAKARLTCSIPSLALYGALLTSNRLVPIPDRRKKIGKQSYLAKVKPFKQTKWNGTDQNCPHGHGGSMIISDRVFGQDFPGLLGVCSYDRCESVRGHGQVYICYFACLF